MVKEVIEIVSKFVDGVSKPMQKVTRTFEGLERGQRKVIYTTSKVNEKTGRMNQVLRKTRLEARKFKFEWLSVMFAGMALSRVFGGLVRTQMELFGVTEMFGATMMLVMLPVMEAVTPILYKILEFFMDLPTGVKKGIGVFIILMAILGGVAMVLGQVMLAVNGVAILFGISGATIGWIVLGVIAAIAGIALAILAVWEAAKNGFTKIGAILAYFASLLIGPWVMVIWAVTAAVKTIINKWGTVKSWFVDFFDWIKRAAKTAWDYIGKFTGIGAMVKGVNWLGGFQAGGYVPASGLAYLHKGETVLPAGATMISPVINVNATVSSDYDVARLTDEISRRLAPEFERLAMGRGTV